MLPSVRSDPRELHWQCRTSQRGPGWALGSRLEASALCDEEMQISMFEPSPLSLEHCQHQSCCFHGGSCASRFFLLKMGRTWDKAHVLQTGGSSLLNPGRNALVLINPCRTQGPFSCSHINGFPRNQLQACFCRAPRISHMAPDVPGATDGEGVLLISESLASRERGKEPDPKEFYGALLLGAGSCWGWLCV